MARTVQTHRTSTVDPAATRRETKRRPTINAEREPPAGAAAVPGHDFSRVKVGAERLRPGGSGGPLPGLVRAKMERAFAADFSDVRLHVDDRPAMIDADAFARGRHIHVDRAAYRPHTAAGEKLLGHELAHVVQQRSGRVAAPSRDRPINADPALESEADAVARKAAAGEQAMVGARTLPDKGPAGGVASTVNDVAAPVQANGKNKEKEEERRHAAQLAHFKALRAAKEKGPLPPIAPPQAQGSASLAHLSTPYVDKDMNRRRSLAHGAGVRFYEPTPPAPVEENAPPRRQISPEQVAQYKKIRGDVIDTEKGLADSHYAFYHAQDPRMRIAQDVYKRVYQRHSGKPLPKDFHFMRFPGPKDEEFSQHADVGSFFDKDMAAHGMIDDNINPTKSHIISANAALHGGLGHAGEETFHYFQIGQGQTELPVADFMKGYLDKFGLDSGGAEDLYKRASAVNATKEGSLFQIMVPKDKVDDVAYMAHPHGLPHDDELLEDLHSLGPIHHPKREGAAADEKGLPPREKMNDEITRNLESMREAWQSDPVAAPSPIPDESIVPKGPVSKQQVEQVRPALEQRAEQARKAQLQQRTRELNERTVGRFKRGDYRPSSHLEHYIHDPGKLQHPEGEAQKLRMQTNPEHFGGQGVRSPHEVMRVQNRANFMQARMLLSQSHMLNPESGIRIKRHTTVAPEKEAEYNRMLDDYVEDLFRDKGRKNE